ncbi:uncharacterized protein DS421_13g428600 [Arachis hypogaea]|nr:uncharacterized protein DS421_13g428600 [Arachis hypogaea]
MEQSWRRGKWLQCCTTKSGAGDGFGFRRSTELAARWKVAARTELADVGWTEVAPEARGLAVQVSAASRSRDWRGEGNRPGHGSIRPTGF